MNIIKIKHMKLKILTKKDIILCRKCRRIVNNYEKEKEKRNLSFCNQSEENFCKVYPYYFVFTHITFCFKIWSIFWKLDFIS